MDKKEKRVSRYSVEKILSHSAENFRRGILYRCINFVCRKSLDKRKAISRMYVEIFLSGSAERLRRGILYCFIDFGYLKSFDKGGGGEIQILRRNFFSHNADSFRRGIFYCCINFGYRESLDKTAGSINVFHRKFLSHSPESFRRGIFYCCSNGGYRKCLDKKGEYQHFPSKIFCLRVPKKSVEESFTVELFSVTEKVWIRGRGEIKIFRRKIFVSQCRNFSQGNPLLLH